MGVDYTDFLHISEDGKIWWRLIDAVKLGSGYLPIRDDDRTLAPVLRARTNRVRVNERTLLSEFSQEHYNLSHPRILVRNDGRYVEAHEFLEWLSQYVAQTQSEIVFPDALASAVRGASRNPVTAGTAASSFESLTLGLKDWFDRPLADLPAALRARVEREFAAMPWEGLTAEQRHTVAVQLDYQRDPAALQDRKFWWEFFQRKDTVKAQLAKWEAVPTPTASDLALREARVAELRRELDAMKVQERQARGDYYPEPPAPADDAVEKRGQPPSSPFPYIAYPKAMQRLAARLGATPEELAAWVSIGPEQGGIAAYLNANELDPPRRFSYIGGVSHDYVPALMASWFRADDIDQFVPTERYITGQALIERWNKRPGIRAKAYVLAKIRESRLLDMHPIYGGTQGSISEHAHFPPLESGLFAVSQVESVEVEDFGADGLVEADGGVVQIAKEPAATSRVGDGADDSHAKAAGSNIRRQARKLETQALHQRWQKTYRKLCKTHPGMSAVWYSQKIAKLDIAEGRSAETIRKHMTG